MPLSDAMVVGEPVLPSTEFADPHFIDDFQSGLDLASPANENTTGKYSDKHWLHGCNLEGGWAEDIVVNKEWQKYTSVTDPAPDGWSPFQTTSEGLIVTAREIPDTAAYKAWGTGKRYDEKFDGSDMFEGDYGGRSNIPGTEGVDWIVEGDGRVHWLRFPLKWQTGTINTGNGRAGIDQGEFRCIAKYPPGSQFVAGGDIRQQSCTFAALWLIQQFYVGKGRNGQILTPSRTHYPFTGSDLINELDPGENGGFDPYTNHNSRHVHDGPTFQLLSDGEAIYNGKTLDLTNEYFDLRCHITPEKIGMGIGPAGSTPEYTRIIDTPRPFRETSRTYQLDPANAATVQYANGVPIETGEQLSAGGDPLTMQMMFLLTLAMDGRWLRDRMQWERQTILDRGYTYPPYAVDGDGLRTSSMTLKHVSMSRLFDAQFTRRDGSLYEPYKGLRSDFTVAIAPGLVEGLPGQRAIATPAPGVDLSGRTVHWEATPPILSFDPPTSLQPVVRPIDGSITVPEQSVAIKCVVD